MLAIQRSITSIPGFADPVSSITHLLAAGVFLVLSGFLLAKGRGASSRVFYLSVFSFACLFQFAMSGVYHILDPGIGRDVLQRLDHAAIFILIAGSFTPIHGILFRGFLRWGILSLIWIIAICGITLKTIFFASVPEWLSLTFYLSLGWFGIITAILVSLRFGIKYNRLLYLSGLAYTLGAISEFARMPILIPGVIETHELFHFAVICGVYAHWRYLYRFADGFVTLGSGQVLYAPKNTQ